LQSQISYTIACWAAGLPESKDRLLSDTERLDLDDLLDYDDR